MPQSKDTSRALKLLNNPKKQYILIDPNTQINDFQPNKPITSAAINTNNKVIVNAVNAIGGLALQFDYPDILLHPERVLKILSLLPGLDAMKVENNGDNYLVVDNSTNTAQAVNKVTPCDFKYRVYRFLIDATGKRVWQVVNYGVEIDKYKNKAKFGDGSWTTTQPRAVTQPNFNNIDKIPKNIKDIATLQTDMTLKQDISAPTLDTSHKAIVPAINETYAIAKHGGLVWNDILATWKTRKWSQDDIGSWVWVNAFVTYKSKKINIACYANVEWGDDEFNDTGSFYQIIGKVGGTTISWDSDSNIWQMFPPNVPIEEAEKLPVTLNVLKIGEDINTPNGIGPTPIPPRSAFGDGSLTTTQPKAVSNDNFKDIAKIKLIENEIGTPDNVWSGNLPMQGTMTVKGMKGDQGEFQFNIGDMFVVDFKETHIPNPQSYSVVIKVGSQDFVGAGDISFKLGNTGIMLVKLETGAPGKLSDRIFTKAIQNLDPSHIFSEVEYFTESSKLITKNYKAAGAPASYLAHEYKGTVNIGTDMSGDNSWLVLGAGNKAPLGHGGVALGNDASADLEMGRRSDGNILLGSKKTLKSGAKRQLIDGAKSASFADIIDATKGGGGSWKDITSSYQTRTWTHDDVGKRVRIKGSSQDWHISGTINWDSGKISVPGSISWDSGKMHYYCQEINANKIIEANVTDGSQSATDAIGKFEIWEASIGSNNGGWTNPDQ